MAYVSYTIFEDRDCTIVRSVANLECDKAEQALSVFKRDLGRAPKEGDRLHGCRIDRIGAGLDHYHDGDLSEVTP